jgi:hypothetical protein
MAETRLPITGGITYSDTATDSPSAADWNEQATAYETRMVTGAQGLRSARPAAGKARRLYAATDEDVLYVDDGAAWHSTATRFWTGRDASGVTLAANNNGPGGASWSVTTPAGSALLMVSVNLNPTVNPSLWNANAGLRIDGVDYLPGATIVVGAGAALNSAQAVPLTAGTHAITPHYVTGAGTGLLNFVTASFTLLMGQAMT